MESFFFVFVDNLADVVVWTQPVVLVAHELLEGVWQVHLEVVFEFFGVFSVEASFEVVVFGFIVPGPVREHGQWLVLK